MTISITRSGVPETAPCPRAASVAAPPPGVPDGTVQYLRIGGLGTRIRRHTP